MSFTTPIDHPPAAARRRGSPDGPARGGRSRDEDARLLRLLVDCLKHVEGRDRVELYKTLQRRGCMPYPAGRRPASPAWPGRGPIAN